MKKFLLFILLPVLVFASDFKSHFFAGVSAFHSKIYLPGNDATDYAATYYFGNGDFHVYSGYEFRPVRWFSLSPIIDVERNGWSWERAGHEGEISYLNPSLRLSFDFHLSDFLVGFGGAYGLPFFYGAEKNGKSAAEEALTLDFSLTFFYSLGYTIKDHYRVGFVQGFEVLYPSELNGDILVFPIGIFPIGIFFTYLF